MVIWSGTKNDGNKKLLENEIVKLVWDFEFHLRKTTTMRRVV